MSEIYQLTLCELIDKIKTKETKRRRSFNKCKVKSGA